MVMKSIPGNFTPVHNLTPAYTDTCPVYRDLWFKDLGFIA